MKQVIYKGIPLASATIIVAVPKPFRLSVSADPSWGKKIFLEARGRIEQSLTRDQAADLAQRLVQAGIILDDIQIKDDDADELCERAGVLQKANNYAWGDLQDALDTTVHALSSREASAINNKGAHEQIRHLVDVLGAAEVEKMIVETEGQHSIDEDRKQDALNQGLSEEEGEDHGE